MANEIVQDLQAEVTFKLCYRESPMARPVIKDVPLGVTVADIRAKAPKLDDVETLISSGSEVLEDSYEPKAGDVIDVTLVPAFDGGITLALVLAAVSLVAAGYALYQAKSLKTDDIGDSKEERIRGIRNRERIYEPLPIVLGKRKVAPCFYARPWTEFVGEDEYFNIMLSAGYGPLKLENFRIGEAPLSQYEHDIRILDYYGYNDVEAVRELWQSDIVQDNVEIEIEEAAGWTVRNTAADPDFISFDYAWPTGVFRTNDKGKARERTASVEAQYQDDAGDWISVAQLQPANRNIPFGVRLEGGQYMLDIWGVSGPFSRVDITAFFSHTDGNLVFFKNLPDNMPVASVHYTNKTAKAARKGVKIEPLNATGNVVVRSRKVAPLAADTNQRATDTTFWATLRTHRVLSDDGFKSIIGYDRPPLVVDGVKYTNYRPTIIVLRIKATNQLNGMLDNFYCDATMVVPADTEADWRLWSTFPTNQLKLSENPADAYRWLLQGPMNANPVANTRLDLDEFERWYDINEADGWFISNIIDYPSTLLRELNNVAFTGRAEYGFVDGTHSVVIKEAKTIPVQVFTPKNTKDFVSSRNFPEDVDGIKVTFNSALADYERDEVIFIDPLKREGTGNPALQTGKFQSIDLWGITDPDLAYRHARFAYYEQALRREVYTFSVDFEALRCTRGDLVYVQNDIINVGAGTGRIKALTASTVTLDEVVDVENLTGATGLQFRLRTGAVVTLSATYQGDGTWSVATPSEAAVGDLVVYGEAGKETIQCIITEMDFTENLAANITAVNAANEMFSFDGDPIPEYQAGTTALPQFIAPEAPFITSVAVDPIRGVITVNLEIDPNSRAYGFVHLLQYRSTDSAGDVSDWENGAVASEGSITFNLELVRGFSYDFRARSRGGNNLYSRWSNIVTREVGEGLEIEAPSNFNFIHTLEGTILRWISSDLVLRSFTEIHKELRGFVGGEDYILGERLRESFVGQTQDEFFNIGYINIQEWDGVFEEDSEGDPYQLFRFFAVADRTSDGLYSNVQEIIVESPPKPSDLIVAGSAVAGLVTLNFSVISVYPIARYEVTSTGGDLGDRNLGVITTPTFSFTEPDSGTYTYLVKAIDVAGNESEVVEFVLNYEAVEVDLESIFDDVVEEIRDDLDDIIDDIVGGLSDPRELIVEGVNDAFEDLDLTQAIVRETNIRQTETGIIAGDIFQLTARIETEEDTRQAQYVELITAVADEAEVRAQQVNILSAEISTETTNREAAISNVNTVITNESTTRATQINQVTALVQDEASTRQAQVNNLSDALVTESNTRATQISIVDARVDTAEGQISATVSRVDQAEADIDGNASAISGLRTAVAGVDNQSQAELILSSTVDKAGEAFSRAFLGVTTTVGGVSRINGIVVDGATNTLEFRADTLRLTDTSGNTRLAFNSGLNTWVYTGDLIGASFTGGFVRTAPPEFGGVRTVMNATGTYPFWIGTGSVADPNYLFRVNTSGLAEMKDISVNGGSIRMIGANAMSIESQTPFGAGSEFLEWKGPKINGVTWNNSTSQPIFSGMTRGNASYFYTVNNEVYFAGSILAGTLKNAVQSTTLGPNTSVETGSFGSNGGLITVKCSFSANKGSSGSGSCPTSSNPTGTMFLDRWNGSSWVQVASQSMVGVYNCFEEGPEYISSWILTSSFTYTDSLMTTNNRQYRLRVTHTTPVLPDGSQNLSLITEE